MFGICNDFRAATVFGVRFVYFGTYYFYVVDFVVIVYFNIQRLDVEFEFYVFFSRVFYFAAGIRYVFFITTIGIGNVFRFLAYGRTYVVYRSVVIVKDYYAFVFYVDERFVAGFIKVY